MTGLAGITATGLLAQTVAIPGTWDLLVAHLISGVIFSVVGLAVFLAALWLIVKFSPFCVVREIEEDQNTALAIIIGSILIGIAIIIAAAIQG